MMRIKSNQTLHPLYNNKAYPIYNFFYGKQTDDNEQRHISSLKNQYKTNGKTNTNKNLRRIIPYNTLKPMHWHIYKEI